MNKAELQLNRKAITEANAVAKPFVQAAAAARIAYETAETAAEVAWHAAYAIAIDAPRNN